MHRFTYGNRYFRNASAAFLICHHERQTLATVVNSNFFLIVQLSAYEPLSVCVCVCVCARARARARVVS